MVFHRRNRVRDFIDRRVERIQLAEDLRLEEHRTDRRTEFRRAVVRNCHMLEQHGRFLADAELLRLALDLHGAHHEVSDQLTFDGIVLDDPNAVDVELVDLADVMQDRAGKQQIAVHRRVQPRDG